MAHEIPKDFVEDQTAVRDALLEVFGEPVAIADEAGSRAFLKERGFDNEAPLINIPYNKSAFSKAARIVKRGKYVLDYARWFSTTFDFTKDEVAPTAFSVNPIDFNVVIDKTTVWTDLYGMDTAKTAMKSKVYGMLCNSVRKDITLEADEPYGVTPNTIKMYHGLSDRSYTICSPQITDSGETMSMLDHAPIAYMVGQQRKAEGVQGPDKLLDDGLVRIAAHYVVEHTDYPDNPGYVMGFEAGQTIESIDETYPGTIEHMLDVIKGIRSGMAFRRNVQANLGEGGDWIVESMQTTSQDYWFQTLAVVQDTLAGQA